MNPSAMIPAAGGGPHPWITKDMWRISCKTATKNGYAGQAFLAHAPDGVKYHFDWAITKSHSTINGGLNSHPTARKVVYFLVSRVEDRFGNWVDYTYSGDKLTGISSSDARQITLGWTGNKITSATSTVGSWTYTYTGEKLAQVTQPDASKWAYVSTGEMKILPPSWTPLYEDPTGCQDPLEESSGSYLLSITAPSGATGSFSFDVRQHHRSNVPEHACQILSSQYWFMKVPRFHWSFTLVSKTVTGPGLPAMTWGYTYGSSPIMFDHTKKNTVTGPGGTYTRYTFGTGYSLNEGQLLKTEQGGGPTSVLRAVEQTYVTTAEAASQNFPASVGTNPHMWNDPLSSAWLRPVKQSVTTQQGVDFTGRVDNACAGKLCFDAFARRTQITKSSTAAGNPTRIEQTSYHDNTGIWVLGQVSQVKCVAPTTALPAGCGTSGTTISETTYHGTFAVPLVSQQFGRITQTLTWDTVSTVASGQRGTAQTVADGKGNLITLTGWKRGIPQSIKYPATPEATAGATQSAVVSNAGWITSVTDENGFATSYTHDAMGRLAGVTYPTGDTTAWSAMTQAFVPVSSAEYGIPAGHWRQTVSTGNGRRITYFDGLWRPLVTREYDIADEAGTQRFQRFTYDHDGRTTFASYPANVHNPTTGVWSEYDTLGRQTSVSQDSELSPTLLITTTQYLTGFQTKVTNPKGHTTTTAYRAWDQPGTDLPVQITHPAGAYTHITRDVFGKPTVLRRSNSSSPTGGTVSLNRTYLYGGAQRLCMTTEPETGSTVVVYDGADNLIQSTAGLVIAAGTSCATAKSLASASGRTVYRTYDGRNRLAALNFPDGNGSQSWSYTPDGLPQAVTTANAGTQVTNTYSYNRRRLLTQETIQPDTLQNWSIDVGYNALAQVVSETWPANLTASYAVNALGQVTQINALGNSTTPVVTGASFYPNGALRQFTYGNGIVHTMTQNARQLPARSTDGGALDLATTFDANGNVSAVTDYTAGGRQARSLSYDGLDRLVAATSPMFGSASYGYDVLDNLSTVVAPGRDHRYHYDASHRLTNVVDVPTNTTTISIGYDVQGNVINKNGVTYHFDYGNRLRTSGSAQYRYDAHGRRVRSSASSGAPYLYSFYDRTGRLHWQRDESRGRRIRHIYLAGSLVAEHSKPIGGETETILYQHTDALGTPIARSNSFGTVVETSEYEPYGKLLNRANDDRPGYTGHVMDAASGLTYMQQRYYDPGIGLFLSVDPVTAYEQPITNFCRYCYARNNPYRFTDPDGRNALTAFGGVIHETGQFLQGNGFDGQMVLGALKDGYNGEGDGFAAAALEDASAIGSLAGGVGLGRLIGSRINAMREAGVSLAKANKIHHIFSQSRHNLGGLAKAMGGEAKAFRAIEKATTKAVDVSKAGRFETTVKVGGQQVTVRGNVVDGQVKVGTAFIKPPPPPPPKITP